jgi:Icc protein
MIIVQLSDLHLRADGRYPRHDAGDALATAVAVINHMLPRPDAVLFTGDLLDRSTRDYGLVRVVLDGLVAPLLPLPGNHDDAAHFRAAFADSVDFAEDHLSFMHDRDDGRVIGLDSNGPGGSAALDDARLDWLARRLADDTRPVLLGLHHPPFPTGMPRYDDAPFPGADALMRLLEPHARRVRLVAGHTHRPVSGIHRGIAVSTVPPLGYSLALSLVPDAPHAHTPEAPAMQIHRLDGQGCVTHTLPLAPHGAPRAMTGMLDAEGRARIIAP